MKHLSSSQYFRVSITDRCNLACPFCHKEAQASDNSSHSSELTPDNFIWICKTALKAGFRKFKLTGGEPTLRKDLPRIVAGLRDTDIEDLSMITNGTNLSQLATILYDAGLRRVNVTLNTLDPERYRREFGGSKQLLKAAINGIDTALDAGFRNMKINYVISRGNGTKKEWDERKSDFQQVLEFCSSRDLIMVLLPVLPFGTFQHEKVLRLEDLYKLLQEMKIIHEVPVVDGEGILKRLITVATGARIILRKDELADRLPFWHCDTCDKKVICREGIFPIRLSSRGEINFCLAGGMPAVAMADVISRRDETSALQIFSSIQSEMRG